MNTKIVELSMKEFLIVVLRRWVPILICAVLLSGIAGVVEYNKYQASKVDLNARYDREMLAYNQTIQAKESELSNFADKMASSIAYNNDSLLLQIDPLNAFTSNLNFSVNASVPDGVDYSSDTGVISASTIKILNENIVDVYIILVNNADLSQVLKGALSKVVEQKYLNEIVRAEKITESLVKIVAIGNSTIQSEAIVQAIFDYLTVQKDIVSEAVAPHKLTSLGVSTVSKMDELLAEQQGVSKAAMTKYSTDIKNLQDNLDKAKGEKPIKPGFIFRVTKNALIGFVVGFILAAMYVVVSYAVKLKIQTTQQIERQLNMRYLGGGLHKKGVFLGHLADKLSGTSKLAVTPEVLDVVSANINELTSGKYKKILLTGMVPELVLEEFSTLLHQQKSKVADIRFLIGDNVSENADSVKKLEEAEAVLFVERIDYSKLKLINQEVERVRQSGKIILGYTLY